MAMPYTLDPRAVILACVIAAIVYAVLAAYWVARGVPVTDHREDR